MFALAVAALAPAIRAEVLDELFVEEVAPVVSVLDEIWHGEAPLVSAYGWVEFALPVLPGVSYPVLVCGCGDEDCVFCVARADAMWAAVAEEEMDDYLGWDE